MWLGVSKAGYSVSEEIPYFFIVFLIHGAWCARLRGPEIIFSRIKHRSPVPIVV